MTCQYLSCIEGINIGQDSAQTIFDGDKQPFKFNRILPGFLDSIDESIKPEVELVGPNQLKVNEGNTFIK